ncbi:MAG TPA: DUF2630 family protein [Chloroflexia bacterium]|nr:DUF2630 family protein [Chloroflexia bacterium]
MDDRPISNSIEELVAEEHALWEAGEQGPLSAAQHARLQELEVALDRCWDLLRQRRALREYGRDPEEAKLRDAAVVERYQQ